jgi:thioredoxin reductase (NADPH)
LVALTWIAAKLKIQSTSGSRAVSSVILERPPVTLSQPDAEAGGKNATDVIVIGAGPTGLACAIEVQNAGFSVRLLDKGCLVNSIYNYPTNMVFFTTPELLEIGGMPFHSAQQKPTRQEALEYYRRVTQHFALDVRQYLEVEKVSGKNESFVISAVDQNGREHSFTARKIIVSTGYYDLANQLGVPGENLPKVFHYYREPFPFFSSDVMIIGGKNSAAEVALDLWRHGARVSLVHRGPQIHPHVKYWVRPDIENRIQNDEIKAYFNSTVREITEDAVILETPQGPLRVKNDFVFALIGYHPDFEFLQSMGIELSSEQSRPLCDPATLETNVPGIYAAGVIVAGSRTNEIFIENGRFHGRLIAAHLRQVSER